MGPEFLDLYRLFEINQNRGLGGVILVVIIKPARDSATGTEVKH
jgi:hypothetical protein